jgi:hypothetical protein
LVVSPSIPDQANGGDDDVSRAAGAALGSAISSPAANANDAEKLRFIEEMMRQDKCLKENATSSGDQLMCLYSEIAWCLAEQGYNLNQ